jgi:hemerythrin superfamily protein
MTTDIEPRSSATPATSAAVAGRDPGDVVTVLTAQHDRARALMAELHEAVAIVGELIQELPGPFRELVALLATHEAAEEIVVYPRVKVDLQEGRLAERCLAEEHEVKELLARLEKMAPAFFEFPAVLAEFEEKLLAHAGHEEQAVFPILEERVAPAERRELGDNFFHVAVRAPSHAHAHSPESAIGNALLGPVLTTLERIRDAAHHDAGEG